MATLKLINQTVAFGLELVMLFMLGYGGYQIGKGTGWRYPLAIGLPILAIALWAYFAAPKSGNRLVVPYLSLFKLVVFSITAFVWYRAGHATSAIVFFIVVILSEFAAVISEQ